MGFAVGMIASQAKPGGPSHGKGVGKCPWAAGRGQMEVAGGHGRGVRRQELAIHCVEGSVSAQMCQEFLRGCETLIARPGHGHPVACVRQGIAGQHESIGVQRMRQRSRGSGGQRA